MQIEGKNPCLEAVKNKHTINKFLVQNNLTDKESNTIIKIAKENKIRIDFVPKQVLDKKSLTGKHQGFIIETVEFKYVEIDGILSYAKLKGEDAFVVLLDEIEDPHNLGAIIRSAECAGVHGIIIPERRACAVNETVIKTSAGAISNMLIAKVGNIKNAIQKLKEAGLWIYAAETGGENIYSQNLTGPIGVIIGSEGHGIHKTVKETADKVISLPLAGSVNSLNASVALGIVVFEIARQRGFNV